MYTKLITKIYNTELSYKHVMDICQRFVELMKEGNGGRIEPSRMAKLVQRKAQGIYSYRKKESCNKMAKLDTKPLHVPQDSQTIACRAVFFFFSECLEILCSLSIFYS